MKTSRFIVLAALVASATGCSLFEDQAPEFISFRMSGEPGEMVTVIYATQFISAANELGTTLVEVFEADTVVHTLPVDTIIDVRVERQLFMRAEPFTPDETINVSVKVDVNDRNIFDRSGNLIPENPWHFLYRFNAPPTQTIEVIL